MKVSKKKYYQMLSVVLLTAAGYLLIPALLKKYSNKLYQRSVKNDPIDIDNLGPEIVKTENKPVKEDMQEEE